LAAGQEAGDKQGVALSSRGLGLVAMQLGDTAGARRYFESGLAISRELDDKFGIAISLSFLGDLARTEKDFTRARPLFEESLGLFRQLDNKSAVSDALNNLGATCFGECEFGLAKEYFAEAADIALDLVNKMTISYSIDGFAAIALENGELDRAARLCGAAEALRDSIGYKIEPAEEVFRTAYLERLRARMPAEDLISAVEQGRALSPYESIEIALESAGSSDSPAMARLSENGKRMAVRISKAAPPDE